MADDLDRYLTVRSAYGASVGAPDGLAFLLDATGIAQVWTLPAPGAWPVQRTFGEEPVGFVDASPTREEYVFGRDEGGNERVQLLRLDVAGETVSLTATPDAKHRWGGWAPHGDRFAFAANRRIRAARPSQPAWSTRHRSRSGRSGGPVRRRPVSPVTPSSTRR